MSFKVCGSPENGKEKIFTISFSDPLTTDRGLESTLYLKKTLCIILNYMKFWTHFMYACSIQLNFYAKFIIPNLQHDTTEFFQFFPTQLVCKNYCVTPKKMLIFLQTLHYTKETSTYNPVRKAFLKKNFLHLHI